MNVNIFVAGKESSEEEGTVVIELYNNGRKLTLHCSNVDYLQSWGPRMFFDMDDGVVSKENYCELMDWFEGKLEHPVPNNSYLSED